MNGRLLAAALACAFLPGLGLSAALAAPGAVGPSLEVSVIHAMHEEQDVRKMGGLKKYFYTYSRYSMLLIFCPNPEPYDHLTHGRVIA